MTFPRMHECILTIRGGLSFLSRLTPVIVLFLTEWECITFFFTWLYIKLWQRLVGVFQSLFLLLPGNTAKVHFPANFAVRCGHEIEL
jgi:hypothetical protein